MTEKKSADKSVTKKKAYYGKENKRKFSKNDLERFARIAARFEEILESEKTKITKDGVE